jgi:hypothetical protein
MRWLVACFLLAALPASGEEVFQLATLTALAPDVTRTH